MTWKLTSIVSGGQRGADRGGLDAAVALDLGWGGWAPHGWLAEDGAIPEIYRAHMRESSSPDYGVHTRLNVQDSDGTLLLSFVPELTGGSLYTMRCTERQRKPFLHLVLPVGCRIPDEVGAGVRDWIAEAKISILNVAGPRESKEPGLHVAARDALVWMFEGESAITAPVHDCTVGFQCAECERSLCWDCEGLMSSDDEIKTAVRWCKTKECAAAEHEAKFGKPKPMPVHLYSNEGHDESEVWCADPNYYRQGPDGKFVDPTRDPSKATCQQCLGNAAAFGAKAREAMPRYRSGPLRETHRIPGRRPDAIGSYTLRLYWTPWDDGRIGWVDFELFEVTSFEPDDPTKLFYERKGATSSMDLVDNLDEAETAADGFVKWDGCTQFEVSSVHIDHRKSLEGLHHAIAEARRLCAAAMPGSDVILEYP